jgi:saccharopine dehydrogenase-like NADP-dependent oxidoreductase
MMRTTAFPAAIVLQMLASGAITKRGAILQERDVPADLLLKEMSDRGIKIEYKMSGGEEQNEIAEALELQHV